MSRCAGVLSRRLSRFRARHDLGCQRPDIPRSRDASGEVGTQDHRDAKLAAHPGLAKAIHHRNYRRPRNAGIHTPQPVERLPGEGRGVARARGRRIPTEDIGISRRYALAMGAIDNTILPTAVDIEAAAKRLAGGAVRTPLINTAVLDDAIGARVFLKAETLQRTGSFKFRGAYNKIASIPSERR